MRASNIIALALFLVASSLAAHADEPGPPAYVVIVHADNPSDAVDRRWLSNAFLKKTTRWPGGRVIQPVDRDSGSPVRERFSERVLGRSVAAVKSYWQQIIFTGHGVPPPELDSDAKVIGYVLEHPGAVGYVAGDAELTGVKTLEVR